MSNNNDDLASYDPRHPERLAKDLIWAPDGHIPAEYWALRAEQGQPLIEKDSPEKSGKTRELCWACGWTDRHQVHSSYTPRVKIFHARQNMGLWDIAGKWVLRDQPNDASAGNDLMTQKFLRAQPGHDIPLVPEILELSGPDDAVQLTLMRQARGERISNVWPRLSAAQREGYVRQMATIIRQLRQFTAPCAQKVDGSLLDDLIIGAARLDHETGAEPVERLVMGAVDPRYLNGRAVDVAQRLHVIELEFGVARNIEMQRAAERDVEHLQAAANGKQRQPFLQHARQQGKFPGVARRIGVLDQAQVGHGLPQEFQRNILAASEQQTVELLRHGFDARVPQAQVGVSAEDTRKVRFIDLANPCGDIFQPGRVRANVASRSTILRILKPGPSTFNGADAPRAQFYVIATTKTRPCDVLRLDKSIRDEIVRSPRNRHP